ncbi:hypothetical protein ACFLY5_01195, partial [Patescibacteria group bacterium]
MFVLGRIKKQSNNCRKVQSCIAAVAFNPTRVEDKTKELVFSHIEKCTTCKKLYDADVCERKKMNYDYT